MSGIKVANLTQENLSTNMNEGCQQKFKTHLKTITMANRPLKTSYFGHLNTKRLSDSV